MLPKADRSGNHDDLGSADLIHKLAATLAGGILRIRSRAALSDEHSDPQNLPESGEDYLAIPDETVLSGSTRVNGFRDSEGRST